MKDDILRHGESICARTEAAEVNVKVEQLRDEWLLMESDLGKERRRLEKIMRLWKEYDGKHEEMYEWLTRILTSLRALEHREKTIDVVKSQIALIKVCIFWNRMNLPVSIYIFLIKVLLLNHASLVSM